jgi:hypothetical protein
MTQSTALIQISERIVDFYGDPIHGFIVSGEEQPTIYIPLRPICGYLGLDWSAQYRRLHRDAVLREVIRPVAMTATGSTADEHAVVCLPLEYLPGWLFSVNVARVRPELQDKITQYRRECFKVLWRAFQAEAMGLAQAQTALADRTDQDMSLAPTSTSMILVQLRDQALAQYQRYCQVGGQCMQLRQPMAY